MRNLSFISVFICCSFASNTIRDVVNEYRGGYDVKTIKGINNTIWNRISDDQIIYKPLLFETLYRIIDRSYYGEILDITNKHILTVNEYNDLNFFCGTLSDPQKSLIRCIDRTSSYTGNSVLSIILSNPTNDRDELLHRQKVIKFFLDNHDVYEILCQYVDDYKDIEEDLISLWTYSDTMYSDTYHDYLFDTFYYDNDNHNNCVWKLEFKKRLFTDFLDIELNIIYPFIIPLCYTIFWPPIMDTGWASYIWISSVPIVGFFYKENFFAKNYFIKHNINRSILKTMINLGRELIYVFSLTQAIHNYKKHKTMLKKLKHKMTKVKTFLRTIKNIYNVIYKNTQLYSLYGKHIEYISKIFESPDKTMKRYKFIENIESMSLNDKSYLFSNIGRILAMYNLFASSLNKFNEIIYEVGLLDTFLSITKLMLEYRESKNSYCFPTYISIDETTSPSININDMWNPFLDANIAVSNDVTMDTQQSKTIIITGPNAGGKSSYLTGIMYNLILAQTLSISPAQNVNMTIFDHLSSYLRGIDECVNSNGLSLFTSKVSYLKHNLGLIKDDDKFSFSAMNEVFSGTHPYVGAALEYSMIESVNNDYENNLTIIASYYNLLTKLESECPDRNIKNYKVFISKDSNGKIKYYYKVVRGTSLQHIAIDILEQNGYKNDIITTAKNILKQHKTYDKYISSSL